MKKNLIIAILFIVFGTSLKAQVDSSKINLMSKRGFYMLPEKGDWALGIDATPIFSYLGSLIGNKTIENYYNGNSYTSYQNESAPAFAFTAQNPGSIYFKYLKESNKAYRLKFLFGYSSYKDKLGSGTASPDEVYLKETAISIGLSLGVEYYRPIRSRIVGYYGYEVGFSVLPYFGELYQGNNQYVLGNVEYSDEGDSSADFTEEGGSTYGFNGAGFVGVEWFFAPKVSLGGEFGLGFNYSTQSEREYVQGPTKIVTESGSSNFQFAPYASGQLILNIYF